MRINFPIQTNGQIYLVMKFGSKDNLESIQRGNIYSRSLSYYKKMENSKEYFFDKNEGIISVFQSKQSEIFLSSGDKTFNLNQANGLTGSIKLSVNLNYPAFCLHSLNSEGWNKVIAEETLNDLKEFLIPDQKLSKYGDHVLVVIDFSEFLKRIKDACSLQGLHIKYGPVRYLENSDHGAIDSKLIGFIKTNDYKYEREYRILFNDEYLPDPFILKTNDLADITKIMPYTEFVKEFYFKIKY